MAEFKLAPHGGVLRAADSAIIPESVDNRDWLDYLTWVAAGGVVDPADLTDLEQAQVVATARVETKAAQAAFDAVGTPAEQAEFRAAEYEALLQQTGVATTNGELPLLFARITVDLTTVTKTAGDVIALSLGKRQALDIMHATREAELAAVAAAVDVAACEAIAPHTDILGVPL